MSASGTRAPAGRSVGAVLFDLDGTLLDTVADITLALNSALADARLAGLAEEEVRTMIGRGVPMLIERAVARLGAPGTGLLLERFHFHYERIHTHGEMRTRAYPGAAEGLAALSAMGVKLAVVTNKPEAATTALLRRLSLDQWIGVVIGGDGVRHRKPHPEPLLAACSRLAVATAEALMVGDSLTDVQAARAAGLRVVCVPYGYNEGADPRTLPCDAFVRSIADLPALLRAI